MALCTVRATLQTAGTSNYAGALCTDRVSADRTAMSGRRQTGACRSCVCFSRRFSQSAAWRHSADVLLAGGANVGGDAVTSAYSVVDVGMQAQLGAGRVEMRGAAVPLSTRKRSSVPTLQWAG